MKKIISIFLTGLLFCFTGIPVSAETEMVQIFSVSELNHSYGNGVLAGNTGKITLSGDSEAEFANFYNDSGKGAIDRLDIGSSALSSAENYIVDIRIRVNEMRDNGAFGFMESKINGEWHFGYFIHSDGTFSAQQRNLGGTFGSYEIGEWFRISVLCNNNTGEKKFYLNENHVVDDKIQYHSDGSIMKPEIYRFFFYGTGLVNLDIDWIRMYSGSTLLSDDYFNPENQLTQVTDFSKTVMDSSEKLAEALSGTTVLMTTNDAMYQNGEKTTYQAGEQAIEIDGKPYISIPLTAKIAEKEIIFSPSNQSVNGCVLSESAVFKNESWYLPLESVAVQICGKTLTWDERGCAILADRSFPVQKYHYADRYIRFHDADLIYRYMQFENPTGETMVVDLKEQLGTGVHPRLLYTSDDISYIQKKIKESSNWEKAYGSLLSSANQICETDYSEYYQSAGQQLAARGLQDVMTVLARAYLLSGEEIYAKKGTELLEGLISWNTIGYDVSNLTLGHWSAAVGIGYDSFYPYLSQTEQGVLRLKTIRIAAHELAMLPVYNAYIGNYAEPKYITIQDNFSGVCGGGFMVLLLSMAEENEFPQMMNYLLENTLKTLEVTACLFYPDGGYYESLGYSQYMNINFSLALLGMKNSFHSFYGLELAKGLTEYGYFPTFLQSTHTNVNFHDGSRGYVDDPLRELWGYLFENPMQAALAKRQKDLRNKVYDIEELFFYAKATENKEADITTEKMNDLGTDRYFYGAQTGAFSSGMDEKNPTFVGFHGGLTGLPHDMLDLGEFVFEANGIKWGYDIGSDDYSLNQYFHIPNGYQYYLKRPEGENCMVFNPKDTTEDDGTLYYGQKVGAKAELIEDYTILNGTYGAMAAYDLTEAYERDVTFYQRGYYFGDHRKTLIVQDEFELKKDASEVYWFMHLPANTEISLDSTGQKAILKNRTKTLVADLLCENADGATFMAMAEEPIAFSMQDSELTTDNNAWKTQKKLAVYAKDLSGKVTLSVKLSPDESVYESYVPFSLQPICEWEVLTDMIDLSILKSDGRVVADELPLGESVRVAAKVGNVSLQTLEGILVLAVYQDEQMIGCIYETMSAACGVFTKKTSQETILLPKNGCSIKAFLWEKNSLRPIASKQWR